MRQKIVLALFLALAVRAPALARGGHRASFGSHRSSHWSYHHSSGAHLGSTLGEMHVHSYHRRSGAYVVSHYRSHPDHTQRNNWSSRGVINPHTFKEGHHTPAY